MGILSPDLEEFMQSIAPGQAGAAGSNLLDRILAERQRQGQFQTSPFNPYGTPTDVLNQGFGTPPFNPNTPAPPSPPSAPPSAEKRTGLGNILIDRLANPLLNKLGKPGQAVAGGLNKFADFAGDVSGSLRQTAERGGLGALAPKFSAGVQAAAQREADEAYRRALLEIQRDRVSAGNADKRRVQSTQPLANGNLGVVLNDPSAPEGFRVIDTGQRMAGTGQIVEIPGLGAFKYDRATDTLTPLADEEAVQQAMQDRKEAESLGTGTGQRKSEEVSEALTEVPAKILRIDENIAQAEGFLEQLRDGSLDTGLIEGIGARMTPQGQAFNSFANTRVLDLISEATFGQLSEGERKFLENIAFSLRKDEKINEDELERYIRIMRKARQIEEATEKRARESQPDLFKTEEDRLREKGITIKRK